MHLIIEKFAKENIINILKDKQFAISKFANIFRRNGMDYDPDILDIRYYYEQESSGNNITLYFRGGYQWYYNAYHDDRYWRQR